jgi:5'-nucleotidase (lipoprotein e(P4) family)
MKIKLKRNLNLLVLTVLSASATYFVATSTAQQVTQAVKVRADTEYQTGATLWVQTAAEYRALAYQAYNLARWQLEADLDKKNVKKLPKAEQKKPRAIMVDIDETVLDNSPAQAYGIRNRLAFNLADWYAWGEMRKAKAIPGSVDFVNYAASKGVKVFYASNRDEVQRQATIENLKLVGFPDISNENVLLRDKESSKEARRQFILQKYRLVLFIGDNLDDHSNVFEKRSIEERFAEVDRMRGLFGSRYIMLPNPMYGTWENAIYDYGRLTDAQKAEKRAATLEIP